MQWRTVRSWFVLPFIHSFFLLLFYFFRLSFPFLWGRLRTTYHQNIDLRTAERDNKWTKAVLSRRRFVAVLSLRKPEFDSRPEHIKFVIGAATLEKDLLPVPHALLVSIIPPTRCIYSLMYHWHHIISVTYSFLK